VMLDHATLYDGFRHQNVTDRDQRKMKHNKIDDDDFIEPGDVRQQSTSKGHKKLYMFWRESCSERVLVPALLR